MRTLFDFFEELDEMVYISDMDTHSLVYMNRHLRESLGYKKHESYKGQKCYNILQNRESSCPFCNNNSLEPGRFLTWIHENPVLHKKVIVKDTMIYVNGHRYRIEIAVKAENKDDNRNGHFYTRAETIMNECLQYFFESQNPEESIDLLLAYLGKTFNCERTYIFELANNEIINNTYEWCFENVLPQKDILQNISVEDVSYWISNFEKKQTVIINDIEDIRNSYPSTYSLLQPQGIKTLLVAPIYEDDVLKGFIGMDNPKESTMSLLEQVLKSLSGAIAMQLKRRNLYNRFNEMSYSDALTGAYNSNAMIEHNIGANKWDSFGTIYCDINGLKETNDTYGHEVGNKLIQECYKIIKKSLSTDRIYRIGGDEFVAIYYNSTEQDIKKDVEKLRTEVVQSYCQISVGFAWSNQKPIDINYVINRADDMMYEEKEKYYEHLASYEEKIVPRVKDKQIPVEIRQTTDFQVKLKHFLSNTYCDVSFLLSMIGNDDSTSYFYFGDMQKNLYFISDNLRKKFGFESNIVPDLINKWSRRIQDSSLLEKFWNDINAMLYKKQACHDLRYPISDAEGNSVWIHCYGKIKWSEDGNTPLFFAGRITHQDNGFVVDSLTNFPTEIVLTRYLKAVLEQENENKKGCTVIGFSFNNMTQINNNHGRRCGDDLIQEISSQLYKKLSGKMTFYRLSGMKCLALIDNDSDETVEDYIQEIKEIIEYEYEHMGLVIQHPCSFAVLNYPQDSSSPQDFIENITALIKVSHHNSSLLYVDNSNGNLQQLQKLSNMEMRLIEDIINDMDNFRIVIQPIVSTNTGLPIGGEVLLRWSYEGENISPAIFIPIIEKENMMEKVGRWVFEEAVHACVRVLSYCPDFYLNVNVSLQQLNDKTFINFIRNTLYKYNLDGKHIVIEMTESCMDEQPEKLNNFVQSCANMDIRTALDDFGSGYSSLRVLLQYPSSIIKLDRTLLLEMSDSVEKSNFITSIVYACHQFGKKVCMEGVETESQNKIVKETGCDMIQGYYYYKPMEVAKIYGLLAENFDKESNEKVTVNKSN